MKIVAIIQARMGSTRLPGKVLRPILGRPMLVYQIERILRIKEADLIVIATTTESADDEIVETVEKIPDIAVFRGSENDVLSRYYEAAKAHGADHVVRMTSDCPLIDPSISSEVIRQFLAHYPKCDYATNSRIRTFPRGLDTEIFTFQTLETAYREAKKPYEREHVTPYIWQDDKRFRILDVTFPKNYSDLRWTVDTPEDFKFVTAVYESLYSQKSDFGFHDILKLLEKNPYLQIMNRNIQQKALGEH